MGEITENLHEKDTCSTSSTGTIVDAKASSSYDGTILDICKLPIDHADFDKKRGTRNGGNFSTMITNDYNRTISVLSSGNASVGSSMQWGSVWIASLVLFLVAVQFSLYFASLWPYMSQIDSTADQTFYGFTLASYSAGQMISSPLLGYLSSRLKRAKPVIALGVCFSMAGSLIYMFTECFQHNRKWVILVARFIGGLGGGNAGTIRGYIATASTEKQRARAVAVGTAALSLGFTAGPAIQACVVPIGYPGVVKGPFHLSQYTAPAYVSVAAAILLLIFLYTKFNESYVGVDERKETKNARPSPPQTTRLHWSTSHCNAWEDPFHFVPKYDKFAVFLCILCWFAVYFCVTNTETVESPYTMAVFNWDNSDAVYYNSLIMTCSSILSFLTYIAFALFAKRINERVMIVVGLCMLFSFYAITFPWPFFTGRLDFKSGSVPFPRSAAAPLSPDPVHATALANGTRGSGDVGCDRWMDWCHYTPRLPLYVYLGAYPLNGVGYPTCNVAISTLFSKIVGPRRQSFVQSLMIMCGSGARLMGPILISWLFDNFGPRIAWTMTAAMISIAVCFFTAHYSRLVPLKTKPRLRSGEKLYYDGGVLHRF